MAEASLTCALTLQLTMQSKSQITLTCSPNLTPEVQLLLRSDLSPGFYELVQSTLIRGTRVWDPVRAADVFKWWSSMPRGSIPGEKLDPAAIVVPLAIILKADPTLKEKDPPVEFKRVFCFWVVCWWQIQNWVRGGSSHRSVCEIGVLAGLLMAECGWGSKPVLLDEDDNVGSKIHDADDEEPEAHKAKKRKTAPPKAKETPKTRTTSRTGKKRQHDDVSQE